jgi:hypothetical protein
MGDEKSARDSRKAGKHPARRIVKRIIGELHFRLSRMEGDGHAWATEQVVGERGESRSLAALGMTRQDVTGAGINEALPPKQQYSVQKTR